MNLYNVHYKKFKESWVAVKVILLKDTPGVGKEGEIREAKPGFCRNYLLPNKLALEATDENMRVFDTLKRKRAKDIEHLKQDALEYKQKLEKISVTIPVELKNEDEIFGSITTQTIAQALKKAGIEIDKSKLVLEDQIKKTGVYSVTVKIHSDVAAAIKVWIVKK